MVVSRYAYLVLFAAPLLLLLSDWLGRITGQAALFAFAPFAVLQVLLPVADAIIGQNRSNFDPQHAETRAADPFYRNLTLAAVPVQFALLAWACRVAVNHEALGPVGIAGWVLSTGYVGAILAINVAHELVHRPTRLEQWAGGMLLSTVAYGTFKVEHLRGHHVNVSTPDDASSARLGESLFAFLPRAVVQNVRHAWTLEARRLARQGRRWWNPANELLWWTGLTVLWAGLCLAILGPAGLVFFLAQAGVAILSLETVNYIEHYGLTRRRLPSGRYERTSPRHSWNSDALLTNLMLLQLARHSDHHANARRPYPILRHHDESPQLPAGYAAMFLLAWCPPLWHRVMDPRARRYAEASAPS